MSNEWEEYKEREAYFNELAEQQRNEKEHQMKEQEYTEHLEQRLKEAEDALLKISNDRSPPWDKMDYQRVCRAYFEKYGEKEEK